MFRRRPPRVRRRRRPPRPVRVRGHTPRPALGPGRLRPRTGDRPRHTQGGRVPGSGRVAHGTVDGRGGSRDNERTWSTTLPTFRPSRPGSTERTPETPRSTDGGRSPDCVHGEGRGGEGSTPPGPRPRAQPAHGPPGPRSVPPGPRHALGHVPRAVLPVDEAVVATSVTTVGPRRPPPADSDPRPVLLPRTSPDLLPCTLPRSYTTPDAPLLRLPKDTSCPQSLSSASHPLPPGRCATCLAPTVPLVFWQWWAVVAFTETGTKPEKRENVNHDV